MEPFLTDANTVEKRMIHLAASRQRPISGSMELLPLCNMDCDMCYVRLGRAEVEAQGGIHTADEWIRLGREMAEAGVLFLLLTGGEPLLFPGFQELYLELKQLGMLLTVNTNGTLISEEWADFFGKHKPRRVNITLYGTDENAYRDLCHYPGGFGKAVRGIRLLKERGVDIKINGSMTKANYRDMKKIYATGRQMGVPVHIDTYMYPGRHDRGKPFSEQPRLLPEDAAAAGIEGIREEDGAEALQEYARQCISLAAMEHPVYPSGNTCLAGRCSFTVDWKGNTRPCVMLSSPSVNAFAHGFREAWDRVSESMKCLCLNEKCTGCRFRPLCKVCPAAAYLETGSHDGVPEYLCRYTEEQMRLFGEEVRKEGHGNG